MSEVQVTLREDQDRVWRLLHSQQNEMIVTKSGRKMFPKLEYSVRGLAPNKLYAMMLHLEHSDDCRYKFTNGEWIKSGKAEPHKEPKKLWHPDGVRSGRDWIATPVCFDRIKITNTSDSTNASMIFLHSMNKYCPILSIFESQSETPMSIPQPSTRLVTSVRFDYTEFIAVTAYQNDAVIKIKVQNNPFAKGFREGGQGNRKRESPSTDESTTEESSASPKPKKCNKSSSVSPPIVPRFAQFPQFPTTPVMNPFLYTFPFFPQFPPQLPSNPFPFPVSFPFFSQLPFPTQAPVEKKPKEETEPEIDDV
ncbi:hypothetical protein L5515_003708 [Caenorhabditis briggsae]|uniref:T-box domain-containing protein n=1 Tax=Caenorhabditis briggsae TaxID=6238 RepID=A0AAE9EFG4_CAEBR|nr:hypothetical protein L5515_003708 [Caenorhabditis briggsae]